MDEARLYTLRVWSHDHAFRAVLRVVGDEHAELFTEPAAVAAYLQAASGLGAPPPGPGNAGETLAAEHGATAGPAGHTRSTP